MAVRLHKLLPQGIRRRLHRIFCRIPRYYEYVSNRHLKKRQKAFPKPLAPRMEHQNLSSIAIDPSTNANCLFLTMLPLEIRLQVYTEVFSKPKSDKTVTAEDHLTFPSCSCRQGNIHYFLPLFLLSLPKTCRQIYIESLPFLYALQPLHLAGASTVVSFSRSILPRRLSLIRYVRLTLNLCYPTVLLRDPITNLSLAETWDIIATQMTGLRELDVRVILHGHVEWKDTTEERQKTVLSGLAKCRGLEWFNVRIEHWGHYGQTDGVNGRESARKWREELARKVTRPRGGVEEIEDKTFEVDLEYDNPFLITVTENRGVRGARMVLRDD